MILKRPIFLFFLILLIGEAKAQVITWSEEDIGYNKNFGFGVLGERDAGIYTLYSSNRNYRKFDIQLFTHNLTLKNEKTINTGKYEFRGAGLLNNSPYYLLSRSSIGDATNHIIGTRLGPALNEIETKELLKMEPVSSSMKQAIYIKETYNQKGLGLLCMQEIQGTTEEFMLYYAFYDADFNSQISKKIKLKFDIDNISVSDFYFDEFGNFYLALYSENRQIKMGQGRQKSIIAYYNADNDEMIQLPLTEPGNIAQSIRITYDFVNKNVIYYGIFGSEGNAFHVGTFRIGINAVNGTIIQNFFNRFSDYFISQMIGAKRQEKGEMLNYFEVKGATLTIEGDLIMVLERYFTALETESYFHNNIPYSTTRKVHHFDEIAVISIKSTGEVLWEKQINKLQTAIGDYVYFCSISMTTLPNQINLFYNNFTGSNSDITRITINKSGEIVTKPLLTRIEYNAMILPELSQQIGYNRTLMRIAKGNSIKLAKITLTSD
jgi:hypothetical protein